jgi:hypothetical protein
VTKRDHASNSVVGFGWGVSVDHMVNSPEIGRASRPIRIQFMVLGDDEDDGIYSATSFLYWFLVPYWEEDNRKFRLQNHCMY